MTLGLRLRSRRMGIASILGVLLLATAAVSFAAFQGTSHAQVANRPLTIQSARVQPRVLATGQVDMTRLPHAGAAAASTHRVLPHVNRGRLNAAQRAAYNKRAAHSTAAPSAVAQPRNIQAPSAAIGDAPNFVGNGVIPPIYQNVEGLSSAQGGGWYPPDQAVAANTSYVLEGVNNAIAIYNTSGKLLYGPYTSDSFFAPVKLSGDVFSDPQITYDATRAVWVIEYLELTVDSSGNVTHGYIDVAVSKGLSPTEPSPGANYYLYRIDANVFGGTNGNMCDYGTLGMDYWGLWISCVAFENNTGNFLGNAVIALNKNEFYKGTSGYVTAWQNIPLDLSCGATPCPAYRLSPAIEDGTPDAEFLVATDAGYVDGIGGNPASSKNLTLVAFTNTSALNSHAAPASTADFNTLPTVYADPVSPEQPGFTGGGAVLDPGEGVKQMQYKGGHLLMAWSTAVNWNGDTATRDGAYWLDVVPLLTTKAAHNPQQVNGLIVSQQSIFGFVGGYTYMPTLGASSELDETLVFNYSSASVYPSIVYTGRRQTDAPSTMGQTGTSGYVVSGTNANGSGRWGDYSACSLTINSVTRGIIWCGGEYGGSLSSATGYGWNTRIYALRTE